MRRYGYGYRYEYCRGHPGAPPIRYYAHSTLSGSTVGRYVLVQVCVVANVSNQPQQPLD